MLSIGKLTAGGRGARYYTGAVARGREDYYAGTGEAPGSWIGSGWGPEESGDPVSEAGLRSLLEGRHPSRDQAIRQRQARSTMGFDLTFSAPKSVSILYGVGPKDAVAAVRDAHDAAVVDALGYLERHACLTRRRHGGKESLAADGFLAAAFRHRTSRAGDPQLHTHVVIANGVKGTDDRWGSLDARHLYRHAKTAGYLYQAALRKRLGEQLGVDWTPVTKGSAEIVGVPRELIHHFSQRRNEITLQLARRGQRTTAAAEVAALDTRRRKDYGVPVDRLRADWRARAEERGFGAREVNDVLDRAERFESPDVELGRVSAELAGERGVTREASTFDRRTVVRAWAEAHRRGGDVARIEALSDEWLQRDDVVQLSCVDAKSPEPVFSTAELMAIERHLVTTAEHRQRTAVAQGTREAVNRAVAARPSIDPEQVDLIDRLVTSGDGVQIVRSAAGTGKTFALDAARDAWTMSGVRVVGCALSARAAIELRDNAGIESTTIARLQRDIDRGYGLGSASVLIVDEAGMVGTRDLARLADHSDAVGAKLVLVGDDRQLPEIDAGGVFRGLADQLGALELREVRRQTEDWDRAALLELRDGDVHEWATAYREHGRVVGGPNAEVTREALVDAWWDDVADGLHGEAVMIALRRTDVSDLNERARARMRSAGSLGRDEIVAGTASFSQGDHVVMTRNDRILEVANGERGRIVDVDVEARSVRVALESREVELPSRYLDAQSLEHAYAMTAHRLQGATVERAHVLGSDDLYREWGYTALSRHRDEAHFYVIADHVQQSLPGMDDYDALDATVTRLERERAKRMATEMEAREPASRDDADVTAELVASMPEVVRGLPESERRRTQVARELDAASQRLQATALDLDELGWFRSRERRAVERRADRHRLAIEHWTNELEIATLGVEQATAEAELWIASRADVLDEVLAGGARAVDRLAEPAHLVDTLTGLAQDATPGRDLVPDHAPGPPEVAADLGPGL